MRKPFTRHTKPSRWRRCLLLFLVALSNALWLAAQSRLTGLEMNATASGTTSTGDFAPLWLTSNRYGVGSVKPHSAYGRVAIERATQQDSTRTWKLGYGLDLVVAAGFEQVFIPQQYYVEAQWKKLHLTAGAQERPMETKNSELSSGALSLGINARPVPQIEARVDWFGFPGTKQWWKWKANLSFGWMTDGYWQKDWSVNDDRYARHSLYHEKSLYWLFGKPEVFPLTYEFGLRMVAIFGGESYIPNVQRTEAQYYKHDSSLEGYWKALTCQGNDATDGNNRNVAGDHVGSYVMQLKYHGQQWQAKAYFERYFEDHSMLTVQYGIRDMLLGGEVTLPDNPFVSGAVVEYLTTTHQSGAVFHDPTSSIPELIAARDNYYNHYNFAGWEHHGLTFGNPLLTSPLYNEAFGYDHQIRFYNNRIKAWHIGLAGDPNNEWHWRLLASFSRNWGSYDYPLDDMIHQQYFLAEATYSPRWATGWTSKLAVGWDHGKLIGNSTGVQFTIAKRLRLK